MENDSETVGGYAVPVDPMDMLQCDSCQYVRPSFTKPPVPTKATGGFAVSAPGNARARRPLATRECGDPWQRASATADGNALARRAELSWRGASEPRPPGTRVSADGAVPRWS